MLKALEQQKQRLGSKGKRESIGKKRSLRASIVAPQGDSKIDFRD